MKGKQIITLAVVGATLVGAGFWAGHAAASTGDPGSAADPLVSKSYVDQAQSFKVLTLQAGTTIYGESGTELILRGGAATAIASPQGGLQDSTAGIDVGQGQPVGLFHLLVVPRTDNRGLRIQTLSWVMVKGNYTLK